MSSPRTKKRSTFTSCLACRAQHCACDEIRPCNRCSRLGITCTDAPRKAKQPHYQLDTPTAITTTDLEKALFLDTTELHFQPAPHNTHAPPTQTQQPINPSTITRSELYPQCNMQPFYPILASTDPPTQNIDLQAPISPNIQPSTTLHNTTFVNSAIPLILPSNSFSYQPPLSTAPISHASSSDYSLFPQSGAPAAFEQLPPQPHVQPSTSVENAQLTPHMQPFPIQIAQLSLHKPSISNKHKQQNQQDKQKQQVRAKPSQAYVKKLEIEVQNLKHELWLSRQQQVSTAPLLVNVQPHCIAMSMWRLPEAELIEFSASFHTILSLNKGDRVTFDTLSPDELKAERASLCLYFAREKPVLNSMLIKKPLINGKGEKIISQTVCSLFHIGESTLMQCTFWQIDE